MDENYKHLYTQMKNMVEKYQDEIVPGLRKVITEMEENRVEVVHGRWVEWHPPMHMIMTGEEMLYRCSACTANYPDVEGYRYCPNCGAMMDGERNSND